MIQDLQNKAEAIKQELLTLKAKGYGNVDTSQIKGDISSLPPLSGATPTLPQTNETGLVGFKDTFAKVMELATQKRDDLLKQFMMPLKGTAAASDFASVLSNFSSGSDTTNKLLLKSLVPTPDNQIITETDASGRVTAKTIDKNTGKIVGTVDLGVIGKPQINENTNQERENAAFKIINQLTTMKNAKGIPYMDANGYFTVQGFKDLVKNAIEDGITREKFIKQYADKLSRENLDSYGLTKKEQADLFGYGGY